MNSDAILIKQFIREHSDAAARALEHMEPEQLAGFFDETSIELDLQVIPQMNPQLMSAVFERMNREKLVQLFNSMEIHYSVLSIRMMHEDLADTILNRLSAEKSTSIKKLLHYFDNSVGSNMDPHVFTLTENLTVKESMAEIRRHKKRIQPDLFVLTSDWKLAGVVMVSALIAEAPHKEIKVLMDSSIISLSPETPIQSVLDHQEWENYYALPVVDNANLFLGAIRLETIRAILARSGNRVERTDQSAVSALGELYRIGLEGLLRSATDIRSQSKK